MLEDTNMAGCSFVWKNTLEMAERGEGREVSDLFLMGLGASV